MENLIGVPASLAGAKGVGQLVIPSWSNVSHTALAGAWTAAGLPDALAPRDTSPRVKVRQAIASVAKSQRLVRPLPSRDGYGIVEESADGDRHLSHVWMLAAWYEQDAATGGTVLRVEPADHPLAATVRAAWADLDVYPHDKLSTWFSRQIVPALAGVAVKPSGGVWWVPPSNCATLERINGAIRVCNAGKLYGVPVASDMAEVVEAVIDGVKAEAVKAAKEAEKTLDGDKTARGIRGEMKRIEAFAARVGAWGEAIGQDVTAILSAVEESRAALVMAEGVAQAAEDMEREAAKAAKRP